MNEHTGDSTTATKFCNFIMHDPWFAWLHSLSELVVQIDEMLDAKEPLKESEAVAVIDQARVLLTPSETGSGFQKKYFTSLQQSPDVVLEHSEVVKHLGAAGATGEKNRQDAGSNGPCEFLSEP